MAFPADYFSYLENEIQIPDEHRGYLDNLDKTPEQNQELSEYLEERGLKLKERELKLAEAIADYVEGKYLLEFRRMAVLLSAALDRDRE